MGVGFIGSIGHPDQIVEKSVWQFLQGNLLGKVDNRGRAN
jgi:hypothetical protein